MSVHILYILLWATMSRELSCMLSSIVLPTALRYIRLSKTLEYIGRAAFYACNSLKAVFLPSTLISISHEAFNYCGSLRFLVLPHDSGPRIIFETGIQ